jgi:hypothetical protein
MSMCSLSAAISTVTGSGSRIIRRDVPVKEELLITIYHV